MKRETRASFGFVDAGRTFSCCVEPVLRSSAEAWWWFRVSSEPDSRFAPFRADPGDTPDLVRGRIVAYYDGLLARRAAPVTMGWGRGRPAAATVAAPASEPTLAAAAS